MSSLASSVSPGMLEVSHTNAAPVMVGKNIFEANTHIGLRPSQEDRLVFCPRFFSDDAAFVGVFDGTVGDVASEFISKNITSVLCSHEDMNTSDGLLSLERIDGSNVVDFTTKSRKVFRDTFLRADDLLIKFCEERKNHYASSTGVAAFLKGNLLTVAHIGDSKACIAKVVGGVVQPEWLTQDHKPNMPNELRRIEAAGGSLTYLHGNKPYIRGGDFFRRQAAGEHPKQLNYSRAFGGKDLKNYGLSAEPDIGHFELTSSDKLILLASDGLWDVIDPKRACEIALNARARGLSASAELVRQSIEDMPRVGYHDNCTVIAIFTDF